MIFECGKKEMKEFIIETIMEIYEFRNFRPEETDQAIMVV